MNVSPKQLTGFILIAETRSFAEASARMHMTQPALSIAIRKLETAVGGCLIRRSTRSVGLTPEGEAFLPVAQRLLRDWQDGIEDLRQLFALQRGKLAVAAMPSFASSLLPGLLGRFNCDFPGIDLEVHDIVMEDTIAAVFSGRVDLGFCFDAGEDNGLEFLALQQDRFVVALPPNHELVKESRIELQALLENQWVTLNRGSSTRAWIEALIKRQDLPFPRTLEAFQLQTVGAMVAEGVGVALVPAICREQFQRLGTEVRELAGIGIERAIGVYYRRHHALSAPARQMLDLCRVQFLNLQGD